MKYVSWKSFSPIFLLSYRIKQKKLILAIATNNYNVCLSFIYFFALLWNDL